MKTLILVLVLVALLAPAALARDASEAELSGIDRPVDAQVLAQPEAATTSAVGEAVMPEQSEVYRHENI